MLEKSYDTLIANIIPEFPYQDVTIRHLLNHTSGIEIEYTDLAKKNKPNKEYIRYLYITKGSCGELRTQLYIASKVEEINDEKGNELAKKTKEISALLQGLISIRKTRF